MTAVLVLAGLGVGGYLLWNIGIGRLAGLWWKTTITRWYCRKFRGHEGGWFVITNGKNQPILATCDRCYAIGDFDLYNRSIKFD